MWWGVVVDTRCEGALCISDYFWPLFSLDLSGKYSHLRGLLPARPFGCFTGQGSYCEDTASEDERSYDERETLSVKERTQGWYKDTHSCVLAEGGNISAPETTGCIWKTIYTHDNLSASPISKLRTRLPWHIIIPEQMGNHTPASRLTISKIDRAKSISNAIAGTILLLAHHVRTSTHQPYGLLTM